MISVIVPVYNVGNYLVPTLDSILNSTYQDFELILVDDGSTDGSGAVCDQYAERDGRIRVIHQENAGVSFARNEGMASAKGEYISFIDADDIIHPEMLSVLHSAIGSGGYDFSMIQMKKILPEEIDKITDVDEYIQDVTSHQHDISQEDYLKCLFSIGSVQLPYQSCCNKMFVKDFIKNIKFCKTGSEDTEWNNRMALSMNRGTVVDLELYYYVVRSTSASHHGISPRFIDIMNTYKICLDSIPEDKVNCRSWCLEKLYKTILSTTYRSRSSDLYQNASSIARSIYKDTVKEYKRSAISWPKKYALLLFYHMPWLYSLFMQGIDFIGNLKNG